MNIKLSTLQLYTENAVLACIGRIKSTFNFNNLQKKEPERGNRELHYPKKIYIYIIIIITNLLQGK